MDWAQTRNRLGTGTDKIGNGLGTGMGGLGPGEAHDTNELGTDELGTDELGTDELCPNVMGTH